MHEPAGVAATGRARKGGGGVSPVPSERQDSAFTSMLLKRLPEKVFLALKFRTGPRVCEIKGVLVNEAESTRHATGPGGDEACGSQSATLQDYLSRLW